MFRIVSCLFAPVRITHLNPKQLYFYQNAFYTFQMLPGWQNPCMVGQIYALKGINMFLEKQKGKPGLPTVCSIAQSLTSCL